MEKKENGYPIPLEKISITGDNPRKNFDVEALADLAASLLEMGQLQNVLVRPDGNGGYQLAAGERRYLAANIANMDTIRADIRNMSDEEFHEIMALENIEREQLTPIEEAHAVDLLLDEDTTQSEAAEKLGKSQSWVANRLRLLRGPDELQEMIISREISTKHAKIMLKYKDYPIFELLMKKLKDSLEEDGHISARELKEMISDTIFYHWVSDGDKLDYMMDPWGRTYTWGDWIEYFDNSKCAGCGDLVIKEKDSEYQDDEKRCLNRECFIEKVQNAKEKLQEEEEKRKKELEENNQVDTSDIGYDEYTRIYEDRIDTSECGDCDDHKLDERENEICLNPSCYRGKKAAKTRKENKRKGKIQEKVIAAVDEYVEDAILEDAPREVYEGLIARVLDTIVGFSYDDIHERILEPWVDDINSFEDELSDIPKDELKKVLFRTYYLVDLYDDCYRNYILEKDLEENLPEALDHYEQPDLEEDG